MCLCRVIPQAQRVDRLSERFKPLNSYYEEHDYLTDNQYYYLEKQIDKAENNGDVVLGVKEFRFLEELAKNINDLKEILKVYKKKGYLSESNYNDFKDIEEKYLENQKKNVAHQRQTEEFPEKNQTLMGKKKERFKADLKNSSDFSYERFKELQEKSRLLKHKYLTEKPENEKVLRANDRTHIEINENKPWNNEVKVKTVVELSKPIYKPSPDIKVKKSNEKIVELLSVDHVRILEGFYKGDIGIVKSFDGFTYVIKLLKKSRVVKNLGVKLVLI